MSDLIDPTELNPGEIPDIPAGAFTQELDKWLKSALRWSVREESQGLPDWPRPADETPSENRAAHQSWFYAVTNFLWYSSTAGLLIRIAQLAPDRVDAIAKELDDWVDAGDFYQEWTWEWAEKRGLDPQALTDETRELLKRQAAEDAEPKPVREPLKTALAALDDYPSLYETARELALQRALDVALEQLGVRR